MLDDYSGPFDHEFALEHLSRAALATLGREYLLAGHLQDRATMPQVLGRYGADVMRDVAIDEWMGASPVYTRRVQRALGFTGDNVATIFKGIQFDVGAPHQFMDFRYEVHDERYGEFWLDCCGALMDVEPMGESFVVAMCHDIEDPTFDATAVATNPRARMRPIHRPPRTPADREPHCRWKVVIDPEADPLTETEACRQVARAQVATVTLERPADAEPGGWSDYSGAFDPDLSLEDLSHGALVVAAQEFCVQGHLLVRSLMLTLAERYGDDVAREIAAATLRGVGPVVAERLVAALNLAGSPLERVAKMLQLHPAFLPEAYVARRVTLELDRVQFIVEPCPALDEGDDRSWIALLENEAEAGLEAIVQAVDPRARLRRVGERAWEIVVDADADPAAPPEEVTLTRFSTGAEFVFIRRREVRE